MSHLKCIIGIMKAMQSRWTIILVASLAANAALAMVVFRGRPAADSAPVIAIAEIPGEPASSVVSHKRLELFSLVFPGS